MTHAHHSIPPPGQEVVKVAGVQQRANRDWYNFATQLATAISALRESGTTAQRPVKRLYLGRMFFDTTLGHPVWYDGTNWVDATGTTV